VLKRIVLSFVALVVLGFPAAAYADVLTFNAPATAPYAGPGGPNQFDLDHYFAYTWRMSGVTIPAGHTITSATLTLTSIRNWDTNPNRLFIHLLNTSATWASSGPGSSNAVGWHTRTYNFGAQGSVTAFRDVPTSDTPPVSTIADNFANGLYASNPLVSGPDGPNNTLFRTLINLPTTPQTFNLAFTPAELAILATYISAGGDFAWGFDADCHFWNNGITFTFTTAPTATPEPATMALLGSGLAGFGYFQRRRRRRATQTAAGER
jgi:hypothetical protein